MELKRMWEDNEFISRIKYYLNNTCVMKKEYSKEPIIFLSLKIKIIVKEYMI